VCSDGERSHLENPTPGNSKSMCGITGIFNLDDRPIENLPIRIQNMTERLTHRDPDYQGPFVSDEGLLN
jgi:asparagine synthetase B (glutamine-hydrolysing)